MFIKEKAFAYKAGFKSNAYDAKAYFLFTRFLLRNQS